MERNAAGVTTFGYTVMAVPRYLQSSAARRQGIWPRLRGPVGPGGDMKGQTAIFTAETPRFFRELKRNNRKEWMDANRGRYRQHVVEPMRRLLDAIGPAMLKLDAGFSVGGRTGENFSRINRDIRFSSDKRPYRPQMYLLFSRAAEKGREGGQLFVNIGAEAVTAGFRIYSMNRQGVLARLGAPRAMENGAWLARQQNKLGRRFESYWYASENGEWTKHPGWPRGARDWKRAKGWVVRKKFSSSAATRPGFTDECARVLREVFPLYRFCCLEVWKPRQR